MFGHNLVIRSFFVSLLVLLSEFLHAARTAVTSVVSPLLQLGSGDTKTVCGCFANRIQTLCQNLGLESSMSVEEV